MIPAAIQQKLHQQLNWQHIQGQHLEHTGLPADPARRQRVKTQLQSKVSHPKPRAVQLWAG